MIKQRNATTNTLKDLPVEMVRAASSIAVYQAMLVGELLAKLGLIDADSNRPPVKLSATTLLELGATLHLIVWRHSGMLKHLDQAPNVDQAVESSIKYVCQELEGNYRCLNQLSDLPETVFRIWLRQFAWTARQQMGTDVLLIADGRPTFVRELAKLLWKNRNHAINSEASDNEN
jgi:hypothetical protein